MIGSSGANVSKESHGSSGLAYTLAFSRLANVIKQSIINVTAQMMVMWPACLSCVTGI